MIIRRYLLKQILSLTSLILLVLVLVFLGQQAMRFMNNALMGQINGNFLLQAMLYEVPHLLGLLLPLALFLAIILTYGRLYADNEIVVLQAAGLSRRRLLLMTWQIAACLFVLNCLLSFWITPWALTQRDQLLNQAGIKAFMGTLLPGRFQSPDHKTIIYARDISSDKQTMHGIFMVRQDPKTHAWQIITADSAKQINYKQAPYIQLNDGRRYQGQVGEADFEVLKFSEHATRIHENVSSIVHHDADTLSTPVLWSRRHKGDARVRAEIQWRIAAPFSILGLTWLAVSMSQIRPRQGRYAKLLPAVLIYAAYANCMFLSRAWLQKNTIAVWLGLSWVQVMVIIIAVLWWHSQGIIDWCLSWRRRVI